MAFPKKFKGAYLLLICLTALCGCQKQNQNSLSVSNPAKSADNRVYHCAASTLYALAQKDGLDLNYEQCEILLPRTSFGNSMLEFKKVLKSLGYDVKAYSSSPQEIADLEMTAVVLVGPAQNNFKIVEQNQHRNHFLLISPVDQEHIEIIDYPKNRFTQERQQWAEKMRKRGVQSLPILICERQEKISGI